ncbi:hypothetical protein MYIN104542_25520 [Mycobacterium intermedium]
MDDPEVTQRKRPTPRSALYIDLHTAAGLAKVPFDFGMLGLGRWKAKEPTIHEAETGLDLTGREVANSGLELLEDLADIAIIKGDAREHG